MKKLTVLALLLSCFASFSQKKVKTTKNPIGWQYTISPLNALPEEYTHYTINVDTDLDPLDFWDEINVGLKLDIEDRVESQIAIQKAHQDTINAWVERYMEPFSYPIARTNSNPQFIIELTTNPVQMENVQVDIDYSDQESILGEINVTANLEVRDMNNNLLMNEELRFLLDDHDGPTNLLRLRHFFVNPSFKLKFKMTKKPEKKKALLEKRIEKYEAVILEYFIEEAGKQLTNHFVDQRLDMYAASFGIKDKSYSSFNDLADNVANNINALTSFNKKKQTSMEEILPSLGLALESWKNELNTFSSNPEMTDIINYNLGLTYLFLNDVNAARQHVQKIKAYNTLDSNTIFSGSFNYYLKGLVDAIETVERFGDRAKVYRP